MRLRYTDRSKDDLELAFIGIDHRLVQIFRSHKLKVCDWIYNYLILPNFQFGTPFGYRYS